MRSVREDHNPPRGSHDRTYRCRSEQKGEMGCVRVDHNPPQPYDMQDPSPSPDRDGATTFIRPRTYISDREGGGNHGIGTGTSTGMAPAQERLTVALSHCREHGRGATQPHCCIAALRQGQARRAEWQARTASLPQCRTVFSRDHFSSTSWPVWHRWSRWSTWTS